MTQISLSAPAVHGSNGDLVVTVTGTDTVALCNQLVAAIAAVKQHGAVIELVTL